MSVYAALVITFIILSITAVGIWTLYVKTNNPSIIDMFWSVFFIIAFAGYFLMNRVTSFAVLNTFIMLLIWAARLSGYLWYTRVRHNHQDKRYNELASGYPGKEKWYYLFNFILQALFATLISISFFFITQYTTTHSTKFYVLTNAIFLFFVWCEFSADRQLYQFQQAHQGQPAICDIGWWKYSRHPNYFFEWCIWCMFAFWAIESWASLLSLLSPLTLYLVMNVITAPITEKSSLAHRGQAYADYRARTNRFFPGVPRQL